MIDEQVSYIVGHVISSTGDEGINGTILFPVGENDRSYTPESGQTVKAIKNIPVTRPPERKLQEDSINTVAQPSQYAAMTAVNRHHQQKSLPGKTEATQSPVVNHQAESSLITRTPVQESPQEPGRDKRPVPQRTNELLPDGSGDEQYTASNTRKLNFGVSALYGFSDISNGQYRVSIDAKRDLSNRVYANVQLLASSTRLSTNTSYEYQAITIGPPGAVPITGSQQTEAIYTGNIYTLGLAPSIGFRVTKKLSVSAGPELQKSLGGAVSLSNKEEFRNQVTNQTLVDEQRQVARLDFGVQSAAQVDVNKRIGFTLLYRYGFTDYLPKGTGNSRNSFMCIGLLYHFNH